MIDLCWLVEIDCVVGGCWVDWVIVDLGYVLCMWGDLCVELYCQCLGFQVDVEEWLLFMEWNFQLVDFVVDVVVGIVGVYGIVEDDGIGMIVECFGQWIVEVWLVDVEVMVVCMQCIVDVVGC